MEREDTPSIEDVEAFIELRRVHVTQYVWESYRHLKQVLCDASIAQTREELKTRLDSIKAAWETRERSMREQSRLIRERLSLVTVDLEVSPAEEDVQLLEEHRTLTAAFMRERTETSTTIAELEAQWQAAPVGRRLLPEQIALLRNKLDQWTKVQLEVVGAFAKLPATSDKILPPPPDFLEEEEESVYSVYEEKETSYHAFVCPLCNKTYVSQRNLDRHTLARHQGGEQVVTFIDGHETDPSNDNRLIRYRVHWQEGEPTLEPLDQLYDLDAEGNPVFVEALVKYWRKNPELRLKKDFLKL